MQESIIKDKQNDGNSPDLSSKTKSASFIFGVTTLATFTGFAFTLVRAKRSYTTKLNTLHTDGSKLALKALGYGTAISVTGCSSLVLLVALALGVRSVSSINKSSDKVLHRELGQIS